MTPHIEVPEEHALHVAQYMILKKLLEESPDTDIMENRWSRLKDELELDLSVEGLDLEDLLNQMIVK